MRRFFSTAFDRPPRPFVVLSDVFGVRAGVIKYDRAQQKTVLVKDGIRG